MRKHNLAFIDIETTGLDVINHEIIEIGCVLVNSKLEILEEFELKIKPEHLKLADPISMKINHYNEALWQDAYSLADAMKILSEKAKDSIMVGQNLAFDFCFLEHAFSKTKIKNSMHYHKLDTISIAWAKFNKDIDFEHFSLRDMCLRFGIENEKAHNALSDARATYQLYKKLMNL